MKARIKFKKYGSMIFISHLDVMRYFRKALRRAQIPAAFTKGLSPHMIMSFASPLSVGFFSTGEYFDIGLTHPLSSEEAVKRLNKEMAEGMEAVSFLQIPEDKKMCGTALLAAADYLVSPARPELYENLDEKTKRFISFPSILALKKTKRSEEVADIRPFIYEMEARGQDIFMRLAAGSTANLNPELVMKAFCESAKISCENMGFKFCRLEMYANINKDGKNDFVSLEKFGRQIG